jgi:hypothetical protein
MLLQERIPRRLRASERRARTLDGQPVELALRLIERTVDAGELFFRDDIAGEARLDLPETLVVGVLERLERAGEIVESGADIVRRGLHFKHLGHP